MPLLADRSNKLYPHIFRMLRPLRAIFHKYAHPLVPSYLPYQLSSSSYTFRSAPNKPGAQRSEPLSLYLPVSFYDCSTGCSILLVPPVRPPTVLLSQSFQALTQRSVTTTFARLFISQQHEMPRPRNSSSINMSKEFSIFSTLTYYVLSNPDCDMHSLYANALPLVS